jgi:hypothetical protein
MHQGGLSMFRPVTAAVALAALFATSAADAQERVQVGTLSCDISAGIGFIIGSRRSVNCLFTPAGPAPQEFYQGAFSKFGLDIGATAGGQMIWAVWSATTRWGPGALAGEYVGASAEASLVAGLGANVLIGGSNRTFALQPVSVQGQVGLNVAIGIGDLTLNPVAPPPPPLPPPR